MRVPIILLVLYSVILINAEEEVKKKREKRTIILGSILKALFVKEAALGSVLNFINSPRFNVPFQPIPPLRNSQANAQSPSSNNRLSATLGQGQNIAQGNQPPMMTNIAPPAMMQNGIQSQMMMPSGGPPQMMMPNGGPPQMMMPNGGPPQMMMPSGGPPQMMMPNGGQPQMMMPSGGQSQMMMTNGGQPQMMTNGGQPQMMMTNGGQPPTMPNEQPESGQAGGQQQMANPMAMNGAQPNMPPQNMMTSAGPPQMEGGSPPQNMPEESTQPQMQDSNTEPMGSGNDQAATMPQGEQPPDQSQQQTPPSNETPSQQSSTQEQPPEPQQMNSQQQSPGDGGQSEMTTENGQSQPSSSQTENETSSAGDQTDTTSATDDQLSSPAPDNPTTAQGDDQQNNPPPTASGDQIVPTGSGFDGSSSPPQQLDESFMSNTEFQSNSVVTAPGIDSTLNSIRSNPGLLANIGRNQMFGTNSISPQASRSYVSLPNGLEFVNYHGSNDYYLPPAQTHTSNFRGFGDFPYYY